MKLHQFEEGAGQTYNKGYILQAEVTLHMLQEKDSEVAANTPAGEPSCDPRKNIHLSACLHVLAYVFDKIPDNLRGHGLICCRHGLLG